MAGWLKRLCLLPPGEMQARDARWHVPTGNVPESGERGCDARDDKRLADEAYSEGVRQLVWKHVRRASLASSAPGCSSSSP